MSIYFWLVVFSFQESLRSKEQEAALRSHPTRSRESEML